jgi:3-mercaptopyruvate sulfurtransferase SseA
MKRKHVVLIVVLAIGIAFALNAPMALAKDLTKKELVEQARSKITEITAADAKAQLDKGGAVFLDCREPNEYKQGHVPGALNIPRGLLEFKIEEQVPDKTTRIVMY